MDLTLLHSGLAAGAALAALPILLHLFQRRTPKKVVFPALHLIRAQSIKTNRRLRIKNWLLLLARMALIALMALALARPTLHSQAVLGDEEVSTGLGLVIDTSLSMTYQEGGQTLLDEAREAARVLLGKTPSSSQVYLIDSAEPVKIAPLSPSAARARLDEIKPRPANRPLNDAIAAAIRSVAESDQPRREVFVLTDLARTSWDVGRALSEAEKTLVADRGISIYVIRLKAEAPRNVAILALEPTADLITEAAPLAIRATLVNQGPATTRRVDFSVDGQPRGVQTVELGADTETQVLFDVPKLARGLHQIEVRLAEGADPLDFDNVRLLAIRVRDPIKVLVVSDLVIDGEFIANALDPSLEPLENAQEMGPVARPFRVERRLARQGDWTAPETLDNAAVVFVNNVERIDDQQWSRLNAFVRRGGGLVLGVGHRTDPDFYNTALARQVMPAALDQVVRLRESTTFGRAERSHPLIDTPYLDELVTDLAGIPVSVFYAVTPAPSAAVVVTLATNAPALLERNFPGGRAGKVLLWTTPLSRRPNPNDPAAWNEFPNPSFWSFVDLTYRTVPYLAGLASERLTYEAGEEVLLTIDPVGTSGGSSVGNPEEGATRQWVVTGPGDTPPERIGTPRGGNLLPILGIETPGFWSVKPVNPNLGPALGFAVNPPAREALLKPIESTEIELLLVKDRLAIAEGLADLKRATAAQRIGRELFPVLMALILILITLENLLANTFYRPAHSHDVQVAAGIGRERQDRYEPSADFNSTR